MSDDWKADYYASLLDEARAENEKLRAALKPFSQWSFEKYDGDDPVILELVSDLRAAAAALKETGDE